MLRNERSKIDCLQGRPEGRSGGECQPGAFGYYLHRKLEVLGVSNLVVQPQDWDERGKGVKTDRIDAYVLAELARRDLVPEMIWLPDPTVRAERERARFRLHQSPLHRHHREEKPGGNTYAPRAAAPWCS